MSTARVAGSCGGGLGTRLTQGTVAVLVAAAAVDAAEAPIVAAALGIVALALAVGAVLGRCPAQLLMPSAVACSAEPDTSEHTAGQGADRATPAPAHARTASSRQASDR